MQIAGCDKITLSASLMKELDSMKNEKANVA